MRAKASTPINSSVRLFVYLCRGRRRQRKKLISTFRYNPLFCRTQKLSKLHSAKQIVSKERATEIIVYFTLGEIELQSKLITLLKRPLFLISFCTAAEAPPARALNEG